MTGTLGFTHGDGQDPARGYLASFDDQGARTNTIDFGQNGDVIPQGLDRDSRRDGALYIGGTTLGSIDGESPAQGQRNGAFVIRFD